MNQFALIHIQQISRKGVKCYSLSAVMESFTFESSSLHLGLGFCVILILLTAHFFKCCTHNNLRIFANFAWFCELSRPQKLIDLKYSSFKKVGSRGLERNISANISQNVVFDHNQLIVQEVSLKKNQLISSVTNIEAEWLPSFLACL